MNWRSESKKLALILGVFAACFFLPVGAARFDSAVGEALGLVRWYTRQHVLGCLVPAFFIAGAISVFLSRKSVMRYLGPRANKPLAYGVASVSGSILAVCSCTVLPIFAGIWRMGAGLGPATVFLYSGPAINILAVLLTARVLGLELGIARAVGAVVFSIVLGLLMHLIFRDEERQKPGAQLAIGDPELARPLWKNALLFAAMVVVLVFANWPAPAVVGGPWAAIHSVRWIIVGAAGVALTGMILTWFAPGELGQWCGETWGFAKQILPLLLAGVFVAGFLLGRGEHEGVIPSRWVSAAVGGNSLRSNFFASIAGALMYFATLTEVPIVQGLLGAGMGKGPALALLLAGPSLSLPNMLVIRCVLGTKKTLVYVALVVVLATASGLIYGSLF